MNFGLQGPPGKLLIPPCFALKKGGVTLPKYLPRTQDGYVGWQEHYSYVGYQGQRLVQFFPLFAQPQHENDRHYERFMVYGEHDHIDSVIFSFYCCLANTAPGSFNPWTSKSSLTLWTLLWHNRTVKDVKSFPSWEWSENLRSPIFSASQSQNCLFKG